MEQTGINNTKEAIVRNTNPVRKKIFTYIRESKKDGSVNTFSAQLTAIHSFIRRNNMDEYEKLPIEEKRNAYRTGRKEFNAMIDIFKKDAKNPHDKREYIGIVFFDVSRMARNSEDFVKIENLISAGYKIYSVSENIIDSPAGKYFFRMIQMESIYYSDRQSSKSQRYNLTILCENPYAHTGGNGITYGYNKGGTKKPVITIHPINSLIVKEIFKLSKEGETGREIEKILKDKFEKQVNDYNTEMGNGNISFYNEDDKEDVEKDRERFTDMEEMDIEDGDEKKDKFDSEPVPAYLPDYKEISNVLVGVGRIQYNGFRNYELNINFEEDIPLFTAIIRGQENGGKTSFMFPVSETLRKGKQWVVLDVRNKLTIIDEGLFLTVTRKNKKKVDETKKHIQVYKGLLFCSCGRPMMGTMEANRIYYWCKSLYEKRRKQLSPGNECHRTTKIPETEIDKVFAGEILSKIHIGHSIYDNENLGKGLYSGKITYFTNQLRTENGALTLLQKKLIKLKPEDNNSGLLQKIEKKKIIISEHERMREEFKMKAVKEERFIFEKIENYLHEEKDIRQAVAEFVLKKMEIDEPHDGENSIYHNKKNTRNSIQHQKRINDIELNPYFNMLYEFGKLYEQENVG